MRSVDGGLGAAFFVSGAFPWRQGAAAAKLAPMVSSPRHTTRHTSVPDTQSERRTKVSGTSPVSGSVSRTPDADRS